MTTRPTLHIKNKYLRAATITLLICFDLLLVVFLIGWIPDAQEEKELVAFRCPDDYATTQEVGDALADFYLNYQTLHPTATREDLIAARIDFYLFHGCISELEKYGYDGSSPITVEVRKKLIEGLTAFIDSYNATPPK